MGVLNAREYAEKMAIFVSSSLVGEYNYPNGTEKQRIVTQEFIAHCASKGQILAKPDIVLSGYSGIIVASTRLEPTVDVTLEVQRALLGSNTSVPEAILKREFDLEFSAIGVNWMGVRQEDSDTWLRECSGFELDRTPTPLSMFSSVINSNDNEIIKTSKSVKAGVFYLCAGDYRKPQYILKLNIGLKGIALLN